MMKNLTMTENTENETINEETVLAEDSIQEMTYLTPEMFFEEASDGNNNDDYTEAIQRCFDAAATDKKSVLFTSGKTYRISDTIDISSFGGMNIEKSIIGYGAKIQVAFEGFAFKAVCDTTANSFNCKVRGLTITATPENDPVICTVGKSSGFNIDYYQFLDFEDCIFENLKYGIYTTDMYYQNIVKCQFIGCKMGMIFDCFKHYVVNNIVIDKCRLTNGLAGIYFKAIPCGCRITNCSIERYKYGVCGLSEKVSSGSSALFVAHNYFELNNVQMLFSGIDMFFCDDLSVVDDLINSYKERLNDENNVYNKSFECYFVEECNVPNINIREILWLIENYMASIKDSNNNSTDSFEQYITNKGYTIGDDLAYIKILNGNRSINARVTRNYFIGTGKIIVGCSSYQFRENCFYTRDCIELENRVGHNAFIEIDDDLYIKTLGTVYLRTHIKTKNDLITPHPNGKNLLCRNIRDSHYFVNGIGKMQLIKNTDMMYPLYDGSFNPDESYKYPLGTTIKIDGKNYPCYGDLKNANNPFRKYDKEKYAYAPIKQLIAQGKDDSDRYVVDATSGMLIDFRNHKYCGTLYGTTVTDNDAYGTEFPTSPIENEIFYKTDEEKYYLWDTGSWKECNYISKKTFG